MFLYKYYNAYVLRCRCRFSLVLFLWGWSSSFISIYKALIRSLLLYFAKGWRHRPLSAFFLLLFLAYGWFGHWSYSSTPYLYCLFSHYYYYFSRCLFSHCSVAYCCICWLYLNCVSSHCWCDVCRYHRSRLSSITLVFRSVRKGWANSRLINSLRNRLLNRLIRDWTRTVRSLLEHCQRLSNELYYGISIIPIQL